MPPLYRIDKAKEVHYALDEAEKAAIIRRMEKKKPKGKINVQRFKGLGEMNPVQLRETTMAPDTRRLVQLSVDEDQAAFSTLDMLLGKKRAADRRQWIEASGDRAEV
jgi:topoisomerase-4 subunit B